MNLLVVRRVHEVVRVAVVVEILHLALVEHRALDVFFRAELVVRERLRANIAHAHLNVRSLIAGREMVQFEKTEEIAADLDQHPFSEPRSLYR